MLVAHNVSGLVAHNLSGLFFLIWRGNELGDMARGDQTNAI